MARLIPVNIILLVITANVWSKVISWWIIAPLFVILLILSLYTESTMLIVLGILIPSVGITPLVKKIAAYQTAGDSTSFNHGLIVSILVIILVFIIEFFTIAGIAWLTKKHLDKNKKPNSN